MAKTLMHGRVAQNYAAMGYYPTDDGTMRGIINLLAPSEQALKFLDPCCGEGTALAQLAYRDRYPFAERYGIELDEGRAATAKPKLTALLEGSALSTHVTPQSADVLFLNPPYAQALRGSDGEDEAARLEHQFLSRFFPALHAGGILIYIIPKTSFDRRWQRWLLARFTDLTVWQAATDRFKQIVIIGRKSAAPLQADAKMLETFAAWQEGKAPWPTLPATPQARYALTANDNTLRLRSVDIDPDELAAVIAAYGGLWRDTQAHFGGSTPHTIRPLHELTDWHTSLLVSSGVVSGIVDNGKRRLLVKGKTGKTRTVTTRCEGEGEHAVIIEEYRDRFITLIKAIDLTPDSARYGDILEIR